MIGAFRTWRGLYVAIILIVSCAGARVVKARLRSSPWLPVLTVGAHVFGQSTVAIVDTGCESTDIDLVFAQKYGLTLASTKAKTYDLAGTLVPTQVTSSPDLDIVGWGRVSLPEASVTEFPKMMRDLGFDVAISPQQFATREWAVVVDLVMGELRREPMAQAVSEATQEAPGAPHLESVRTCNDPDAPAGNLVFVVHASIEGVEADLILDTGADNSVLSLTSKAGLALRPRATEAPRKTQGLGGEHTTLVTKGVQVQVGDLKRTINVSLLPPIGDPTCTADGALGLDVLHDCLIVLTPTRALARCAE